MKKNEQSVMKEVSTYHIAMLSLVMYLMGHGPGTLQTYI